MRVFLVSANFLDILHEIIYNQPVDNDMGLVELVIDNVTFRYDTTLD